jgi:cytosine/adenosine deaminase-related metal-dependent hydrolase
MKCFSAQYILTNSGPPLKRAVITTGDDGTIISIDKNDGNLEETRSVSFYNGIIIPGFVYCHSHLELSHMKGIITEKKGLSDFIMQIRNLRNADTDHIREKAIITDRDIFSEGIQLCADICNTPGTFEIKMKSSVRYINLIEAFGIDPGKAGSRMNETSLVVEEAEKSGLPWYLVPHSVYSVSIPLFRALKEKTKNNKITSIHFMETKGEELFLKDQTGPLIESYRITGLLPGHLQAPLNHVDAILNEVTLSGNLILVHNTFADSKTISEVMKRGNTYWCLCPASNMYIEDIIPPVEMMISLGCEIVIGTDSLAAGKKLSILSELKILQEHIPSLGLEELVRWSTINGARALGEDQHYGKIEPGMKPGLLLLQDVDLQNFKLLPESTVTRLI